MPTIYKEKAKRPKDTHLQRQRIYNTTRWRRLRRYVLNMHPICQKCHRQSSEEVHHRDSFMNYTKAEEIDRVAYDPHNLVALCSECHKAEHRGGKRTKGE